MTHYKCARGGIVNENMSIIDPDKCEGCVFHNNYEWKCMVNLLEGEMDFEKVKA